MATPVRPRARCREPERDILAEHFGDDWRTSFGFTPTSDDDLESEAVVEPIEEQTRTRTRCWRWSRRRPGTRSSRPTATQARVHHPDLLFGQSAEETAAAEERIRVINAAYKELRVRRGM